MSHLKSYSPRRQEQPSQQAACTAIVEQTLTDDEAAIEALVSGEIDVLERVPPWQVERLRGVKGIRVESYRLPTVHVLIPNTNRPILAKRNSAVRGLSASIARGILNSVLLGGTTQAGFEVISGPFPAGTSLSDPLRYGYSNRIAPRAYEPRLAAILSTVAWAAVNNPTGKKGRRAGRASGTSGAHARSSDRSGCTHRLPIDSNATRPGGHSA